MPVTLEERNDPATAIVNGGGKLAEITLGTFAFIGNMISGRGKLDQVGGPVRIADYIKDAAGRSISQLLFMVAFISLQLGILNLLPIPALDGGHIFYFLVPEALRGGPLKPQLRAKIQTVGITLLMLLMIIITYNDIVNLL